MFALASSDAARSHIDGSEKSSVSRVEPRPGRISGVGALVEKTPSVGVAVGGNQFMVGEGSGVSVAGVGMGVTLDISSAEQDVKSNVVARAQARSNLQLTWGLRRREEHPPRNDIKFCNDIRNIIYV